MEGVDVKIANKIFVNSDFKLKPEYQSKIQTVFNSAVEPLDVSKPKQSVDDINKWVSDTTNDKIKNLIQECNYKLKFLNHQFINDSE